MESHSYLPRLLMLVISVVQGLILLALYLAFDTNVWPTEHPVWSFPLWTFAVAAPIIFLLCVEADNINSVLTLTGFMCIPLILVAGYVGWQAQPYEHVNVSSIATIFVLSISVAVFKSLMYMQQRVNHQPRTYDVLFKYSWRNFLVAALSLAFVGGVALILVLWSALFAAIGIDFFSDLFTQEWFLFPVMSVAFGQGVIIFRSLTHVIDSITRLLEGLIRLLLPLVSIVALIFLGTLPFVGIELLWKTGRGTSLLLWLSAFILFFINAVYQPESESTPYPRTVHMLILLGVCVLPVVSVLSFYGLWLRVDQYGWTVERCWAMAVWLVLALFSLGYAVGVIRRGANWPDALAQVNTYMGLFVLALMLLVNSPVLDFRKITLDSQVARVERAEINWEEFDFFYAMNNLGRPGYLLKEQLLVDIGDSNKELKALIENPRYDATRSSPDMQARMWDVMMYRPEKFDVPAKLKQRIHQTMYLQEGQEYVMLKVDLTRDGVDDYAVLEISNRFVGQALLFYLDEQGVWRQRYLSRHAEQRSANESDAVREAEISVRRSQFDDLEIGGFVFSVQ